MSALLEETEQAEGMHTDWYKVGKSLQEFHDSDKLYNVIVGSRGCLRADTPVYDPIARTSLPVAERAMRGEWFHVLALTPQGVQIALAGPISLQGVSALVKVTFSSGKQLYCAPEHKLLTPQGWQPVSSLCVGQTAASSDNPLPTNWGNFPATLPQDAPHWRRTVPDSLENCSAYLRQCDEQLRSKAVFAQVGVPSRGDARGCIPSGPRSTPIYSHQHQSCSLASKSHSEGLCEPYLGVFDQIGLSSGDLESQQQAAADAWTPRKSQSERQSPRQSYSGPRTTGGFLQQEFQEQLFEACSDSIRWERITEISASETAAYYDLHVPFHNNYWADGLWHHNCGKTTSVCVDQIGHCFHNAGARVINMRKSEQSQMDTSLQTYMQVYEAMGSLYRDTGASLFKSNNGGKWVRVPSRIAIERFNNFNALRYRTKSETIAWLETEGARLCGTIEFRGLPNANISQNKLRGLECSYMAFIEADLMEERDLALASATLRWKGADPETCNEQGQIRDMRVVLDTNPPSPRHWIAQMEEKWKKGDPAFEEYRFWHIPVYENIAAIGEAYIRRLENANRKSPARFKKYVLGEYAEEFDGSPVYWQYDELTHAHEDLVFPRGAYLIRSYDFGTNNSIVWSAYYEHDGEEYWDVLHEYYAEGSDTETQARSAVRITEEEFPFWNDRSICAGVRDACDPAGNNSNFGSANPQLRSSVSILKSHGISPAFVRMPFQHSIAIVNRLLEKRDKYGRPCFRVDKKSCPMTYEALCGAYRWPKIGESGYDGPYPVKGKDCGGVDHVVDGMRYGICNHMRLVKAEVEALNKPVGVLAHKRVDNLNPDRWRR